MKLIRHPHVVQLYEVCPLSLSVCIILSLSVSVYVLVCAYICASDCGFSVRICDHMDVYMDCTALIYVPPTFRLNSKQPIDLYFVMHHMLPVGISILEMMAFENLTSNLHLNNLSEIRL